MSVHPISRPSAADRAHRLVLGPPEVVQAPELTAAQQQVVEHTGGPLLVVGGPGTGKTLTLAEAATARIAEGMSSESVLVLTFGRRAARAMRRRISARLDRTLGSPMAFTVHGFCLALLQRYGDAEVYGDGLRLLSGPEQEFRVREVLNGTDPASWPEELEQAWSTRAFAAEIRSVLARTRQWGMDPEDLVTAGRITHQDAWVRVGEFFGEYLDVLDAERVMDYEELVMRTRIMLADPEVGDQVRAQFRAIYVDEYAELDPAQTGLLSDLVTPDTTVVAAGDPDQAIFGFRGSLGRGILDFSDSFTTAAGEPAPVLALAQDHRSARAVVAASNRLSRRLPLPRAVPGEVRLALRERSSTRAERGRVEVHTCETAGAEADHIAHLLRRAHLHDELAWNDMAVLVRSGRQSIPTLVRALTAAGVPVTVAGDEIPLAAELAVRPLLLGLQVAVGSLPLTRDDAAALMLSPLGGLDALGLRRLGRVLREAERSELAGAGLPRPSDELLRLALLDPEVLESCPETTEVARARKLGELLRLVGRRVDERAGAAEALWLLWSATSWPQRLADQALAGGDAGRRADRDLDAVCALFDLAARSEEESGRRAVASFVAEVESQQIPNDSSAQEATGQAPLDLRGGRVRVATAHRAKGQQWPLVVVAGVQEGVWPNLRSRDSLLGVDRLTPDGVGAPVPTSARIAEERRLFHVACSRAVDRLVVTAVNGTTGEGDQPSRFLGELGVEIEPVVGRSVPQLTLPALVAELRRTASDPERSPALRRAAATRLARLAAATDDQDRPLVPQADPGRWWGMAEHTRRADDRPDPPTTGAISMSGSQLGSLLECPRRWFLSRRVRAERGRGTAASFGSVMHVLVQHATTSGQDPVSLVDELDQVWHQLDFDAVWVSGVERAEAETALQRFANWQAPRTGHEVIGVELPFATDITLAAAPDEPAVTVHITGTIDRLERDELGRYHVIDFKTGRNAPPAAKVATDPQLGLYQLAVWSGAVPQVPAGAELAGGELVHLRIDETRRTDVAKSTAQASIWEVPWPDGREDDEVQPSWIHAQLARAARTILAEDWYAMVNDGCRYCPFATSCPTQSQGRQVVA